MRIIRPVDLWSFDLPDWLAPILTLLFAIHLVAFGRLAVRQGGAYRWLLCLLFAALTASFAFRWLAPEASLGATPVHGLFRYVAWATAGVTVPILLWRLAQRFRARTER
ncbi:MAG: hypothetical protein AAGE01_14510 [Pseudomonadota bacterium]